MGLFDKLFDVADNVMSLPFKVTKDVCETVGILDERPQRVSRRKNEDTVSTLETIIEDVSDVITGDWED